MAASEDVSAFEPPPIATDRVLTIKKLLQGLPMLQYKGIIYEIEPAHRHYFGFSEDGVFKKGFYETLQKKHGPDYMDTHEAKAAGGIDIDMIQTSIAECKAEIAIKKAIGICSAFDLRSDEIKEIRELLEGLPKREFKDMLEPRNMVHGGDQAGAARNHIPARVAKRQINNAIEMCNDLLEPKEINDCDCSVSWRELG